MTTTIGKSYSIRCDHAAGTPDHCTADTASQGGEYAFWGSEDDAELDWENGDGQATPDGKHYCHQHQIQFLPTDLPEGPKL